MRGWRRPWRRPIRGWARAKVSLPCAALVWSCAPAEERLTSFCRIVDELDPGAGRAEAARCLQCDLRLKIERVKFWGEY